jgi:prevent-host-death family protein
VRRVISTTELKTDLEAILRSIAEDREPYIIERDGEQTAVLVSPEAYDRLRRDWAWGVVDRLGAMNAGRDPDDILDEVAGVVDEVKNELYAEQPAASRRP